MKVYPKSLLVITEPNEGNNINWPSNNYIYIARTRKWNRHAKLCTGIYYTTD